MQKPKKKALTPSIVESLDYATTKRDGTLKGKFGGRFAVRVYEPKEKGGEPAKSYGLITKSASGKESFTPLPEEFRDATKVPLAKAYREAARLLEAEEGGGGIKVEKELARRRHEAERATQRTFGMVLELWWAETADERPQSTATTYRVQIDKRILPALGHRLLVDVDRTDINRMRKAHKHKPSSANMAVSICAKVFDFAADEGWIKIIPTFRIKSLKEEGHQEHVSDADIVRLYHALSEATYLHGKLKGTPNPARLPLILAAITGCRIGEAEGITHDEIRQDDQGRTFWYLPASRTKQKRDHINWLTTPEHIQIARATAAAFDPSLTKEQRRYRTKSLFDRIARQLGLLKCGPHVFRRAVITEQLRYTKKAHEVQKQIGHANLATTMDYEDPELDDRAFLPTLEQAKRRGF